jgi:hypothetical protein
VAWDVGGASVDFGPCYFVACDAGCVDADEELVGLGCWLGEGRRGRELGGGDVS